MPSLHFCTRCVHGKSLFFFPKIFFLRKHSTWPYERKYTFFSSLVFTIIVSPAALHSMAVISKESLSGPRPLPVLLFLPFAATGGTKKNSKSSRGPQKILRNKFRVFLNKIFCPSKNAKKVFFPCYLLLNHTPFQIPPNFFLFRKR